MELISAPAGSRVSTTAHSRCNRRLRRRVRTLSGRIESVEHTGASAARGRDDDMRQRTRTRYPTDACTCTNSDGTVVDLARAPCLHRFAAYIDAVEQIGGRGGGGAGKTGSARRDPSVCHRERPVRPPEWASGRPRARPRTLCASRRDLQRKRKCDFRPISRARPANRAYLPHSAAARRVIWTACAPDHCAPAPAFSGAFDDFSISPYRSGPASSPRRAPRPSSPAAPETAERAQTTAPSRARGRSTGSAHTAPPAGRHLGQFQVRPTRISRTGARESRVPRSVRRRIAWNSDGGCS